MNDVGKRPSISRSQWSLIFLILAVTIGGLMYRVIVREKLEQTAVLFIGIPAVLAILLAMMPNAKTAKGAIMKGLTLALLLSGPVLGEGFICIVMASPIFYLVGLAVGAVVDANRAKRYPTLSCLVLILLPMSIEGTSPNVSFNREETVQASQVVDGSEQDVRCALSHSPRTDLPLPMYGRMGFPRPTKAWGDGLQVGATRTIHFAGGEGKPGDLLLKVTESRPGYVRFEAISDRSKLAHWHFERRLDPAWYFRPWSAMRLDWPQST